MEDGNRRPPEFGVATPETTTKPIRERISALQTDLQELIRNPRMKTALKAGAMLLLASQLMWASDAISEPEKPSTPDQLAALVHDFNAYLHSGSATGAEATEGLDTLINLAKKTSNNPFSPEVRSSLGESRRTIEILGLPVQVELSGSGSAPQESFDTDIDVDPEGGPTTSGLKVPDQPKYYGDMAIKVVDSFKQASEIFSKTLADALTHFAPIEFTLKNGTTAHIDGLQVRDLRVYGNGSDESSEIDFTVEFTSSENKNSEGGPVSYGGFTVHLGADKHVVYVRRQQFISVPQNPEIALQSVQTAADLFRNLGFTDLTWAVYTPASDNGESTTAVQYTVTNGEVKSYR